MHEHKWVNNRHGLDDYYVRRKTVCRDNVFRKPRSLKLMAYLTLMIILILVLLAYNLAKNDHQYQPPGMPVSQAEKTELNRRIMDEYRQYVADLTAEMERRAKP